MWTLALKEAKGLAVVFSEGHPEELRDELLRYRSANPDWVELNDFYFLVRGKELIIRRIRNTLIPRTDGDYRPL